MENGPCIRDVTIEHADSGVISYVGLPEGLAMVVAILLICSLVSPN